MKHPPREKLAEMAERLLQHDREAAEQRRAHPRIQAAETVSVSAVQSNRSCDAVIVDVSTCGMSLTASSEFAIGSTVIVEWGSGFVPCTVRHCGLKDGAWVMGVEVEPLPGAVKLLSELVRSAQQRNRRLLLQARICA